MSVRGGGAAAGAGGAARTLVDLSEAAAAEQVALAPVVRGEPQLLVAHLGDGGHLAQDLIVLVVLRGRGVLASHHETIIPCVTDDM